MKHSNIKSNDHFFKFVFLSLILPLFSLSQQIKALTPPPPIPLEDNASVQLTTGYPSIRQTDLFIGNGISMLSHTFASHENMFWGFNDNFTLQATPTVSTPVIFPAVPTQAFRIVAIGHASQTFRFVSGDIINAGIYQSVNEDGGKLVQLTPTTFQYTDREGTISVFGGPVETITYPNGFVITIHKKGLRIQSVTTNTGLQFKYNYRRNIYPNPSTNDTLNEWRDPSSIVAINNAIEYCDPTADSCALTNSWPTVNYTWPVWNKLYPPAGSGKATGLFTVTDAMNRTTTYTHSSYTKSLQGGEPYEPRITSINGPDGSQSFDYNNIEVCEQAYGITLTSTCTLVRRNIVVSSTVKGVSCSYSYQKPQVNHLGMQITSRCGNDFASVLMDNNGAISGPVTAWGSDLTVHFSQDNRKLITSTVNKNKTVSYEYDSRGNNTKRTHSAAAGSAEAGTQLITDAGYAECNTTNWKWCNKPIWTRAAEGYINGYRTDYTYYDEHGGVRSVELPANKHGFRAKTNYIYEQRYAKYLNVSGVYANSSSPVWVLTSEQTCTNGNQASNGACDQTQFNVVKNYEYGTSGSQGDNLWLKGESITADQTTRRTCYQYNKLGQRVSVISPKALLSSCL